MSISVIGGGAFGTALAIVLASDGTPVTLWMRDGTQARDTQKTRRTPRLPQATLPSAITVTSDIEDTASSACVLLAIPAQHTKGFLADYAATLPEAPLVFCAKGLTRDSLETQTQLTDRRDVGVLTGPGYADEISRGHPTALTIAASSDLVDDLQQLLSRQRLRLYRSHDMIGAQLGGALKNVIAIAAGIAIGAGFGESARAALVTRGFAEMRKLAAQMGAKDETLSGLSGFGDLMLTCASAKSRNFAHGLALGQGQVPPAATVEGIATARATVGLGENHRIEMPIAKAVLDVLDGASTVNEAVTNLLARPLRAE